MNKVITPSQSTLYANQWFAKYLRSHIKSGDDLIKLSKAVGISKNSLTAYKCGHRSPKLEVVAKIAAYYGDQVCRVPLTRQAYDLLLPYME